MKIEQGIVHIGKEPDLLRKWTGGRPWKLWSQKELLKYMWVIREICKVGHRLRAEKGIPIRQPLKTFYITEELVEKLIHRYEREH